MAAPALAASKPLPKAELWAGLAGDLRPDVITGGATGWLGFIYPLTSIFRFEADVGLGAYPPRRTC